MIIFCTFVTIILSYQLKKVNGSLDLFVGREEAENLLGVTSQIWYVRNGEIRTSALSYVIKVSTDIDVVTFYWQNKHLSTMPYTLDISINNKHAIQYPRLENIKKKGLVPNFLSKWSVVLNCTGNFISQAHVNITLKVPLTQSLQNISQLVIQRQKICSRKSNGDIAVEPLHEKDSRNVLYIVLGFLSTFLVTAAIIVGVYHIRATKYRTPPVIRQTNLGRREDSVQNEETEISGLRTTDVSLSDICQIPHSIDSIFGVRTAAPTYYYSDPREGNMNAKLEKLNASSSNLVVEEMQLEGTFGRLFNGTFLMRDSSTEVSVIIKTVIEGASDIQKNNLLSEGLMLAGLSHENLLPVIATIMEPQGTPKIVFQSYCHVNLKRFLHGCHTLLSRDVVCLGSQVLNGLSFLHSQLFVHKDVASRNCFLDDSLHLKLCDCALSRDIFPEDYHCLADNENRPVKWLALECLDHKQFSPASDVWSWGVLLWELMTLGQQPYLEIDPVEMAAVLSQEVRLAQPINCPDELFKAMTYCWNSHPNERPTIEELQIYLQKFLQHLDTYV